MDELKNLAERIETDLSNKKSFLNPLIEKSAQHKKKIEELQKSMLKNISKKKESVEKYTEESKHIIKNFEKFLNYKTNIEKKLDDIDDLRLNLEKEFKELIESAKGFNIISKSATINKQMSDLKTHMDSLEKKKTFLRKKIFDLLSFLKD